MVELGGYHSSSKNKVLLLLYGCKYILKPHDKGSYVTEDLNYLNNPYHTHHKKTVYHYSAFSDELLVDFRY